MRQQYYCVSREQKGCLAVDPVCYTVKKDPEEGTGIYLAVLIWEKAASAWPLWYAG